MKNPKKQPPASKTNNVKVTDAKTFNTLKTLTPSTKKSIVPTPKATSKPKPKSTSKPKAASKPQPKSDTTKTSMPRLMLKTETMPLPSDSSFRKIPKGYAPDLMESIKSLPKPKTMSTIRRGFVSSNGDTTMGPPKNYKTTKISKKEYNR